MSADVAVVINNEDVLCHYTDMGWLPIEVVLHEDVSNLIADVANNETTGQSNPKYQRYQIGCVPLLPSAAISSTDVSIENTQAITVLAVTHAITADYAETNGIALPMPLEVNDEPTLENIGWVAYRQLIMHLPTAIAETVSQSIQLLRWQADTQFCSRCGHPAIVASFGERAMVCTQCSLRQYPRVQPCVITAITRPNPVSGETQILLAHHHRYGRQTAPLQYGLIAGFVEVGESLEHAVVREVSEEVNISLTDIQYVSSQPWPYPSNLMIGFRAAYAGGEIVIQEEELSHADFFDLTALPKIPSKGSIAYHLIAQIADEQGFDLL